MHITIHHTTTYHFDQPVYLEPHVIRLRPRADASLMLETFDLEITPQPSLVSDNLDYEGNVVTRAWFENMTDELRIVARAGVDTLVTDPFHFLLTEPERTLPYAYSTQRGQRLSHYRRAPDAAAPTVREVALRAARNSARQQGSFPLVLCQLINREFGVEVRTEGPPWLPEETVAAGKGACRDVAVLFVECARSMGLAARFVSGYTQASGTETHELHAWGEVYLNGGGWRGFDPSQGLAVADRHIAVAAAADPTDAAPVEGAFRGSGSATLETLVIVAVPSPPEHQPS